jgi:UDP-N-acetylmuramate--alanine ligase
MNKHYHFIGIGGIGMSGIAQLLLGCEAKVSGSDLRENAITRDLASRGAHIFIGHSPENVKGADIVVYSSAIREDNPEILEARRQKIPLVMRAQALAQLMQEKFVVTVAGSHGKTTTTSLVSYLLLEAGLSPTVAVGGILKNIDTNACLGNGKFFVAEADESDGSFLFYNPKYSIITNIDHEHLDFYKTFEKEVEAFKQFIWRTDKGGCVFCCSDDPQLMRIIKDYPGRFVTFGLNGKGDIFARDIKFNGLSSEFECVYKNKPIGKFYLALGGEHNISNALSVIALGLELGIDVGYIRQALSGYKGAGRRLETKFSDAFYLVLDDYAHHPSEIQATLKAVSNLSRKRVIAVFQPHRFTRTKLLLEDFSKSFSGVDYLIITDIYAASESPIEGVSAEILCDRIREVDKDKEVHFVPKDKIVEHILKIILPRDLVITLGAGDIVRVGDELAKRLKDKV